MILKPFYFLLLFISMSGFTQTDKKEEDAAKRKVLENYAEDKDHKLLQKVKDTVSDSVDAVKGYFSDDKKPEKKVEPEVIDSTEVKENPDMPQMPELKKKPKENNIDEGKLTETLKSLENNPMLKMLSPEQRKAAARMMQKNPFAEMEKKAIKTLILTKMDPKKPAGKFVHDNPKVVDVAAEWVIDDKAIPSFVSIVNKPNKAKTMAIVVVVVFLSVFFLNLKNSKGNILKRIMIKIGLMLTSAVVTFSAFYFIYQEELEPTIRVISKSL